MPYNEQRGYSLCREATKEKKINAVGIVEYYRSAKQVCFGLKLGGRQLSPLGIKPPGILIELYTTKVLMMQM